MIFEPHYIKHEKGERGIKSVKKCWWVVSATCDLPYESMVYCRAFVRFLGLVLIVPIPGQ